MSDERNRTTADIMTRFANVEITDGLSDRAYDELHYAKLIAPSRGGYIWEGARPRYEQGEYQDSVLDELLASNAIEPHPDPTKGWIIKLEALNV